MIILASKSPRRQELIRLITTDFEVKSARVDETLSQGISPQQAVEYLSRIKAQPFANDTDIIIGADTVVSIDNIILGKPADKDDARRMLSMLSGKWHSVLTGVTVIKGEKTVTFHQETKVKFFDLTDEEIDRYIATGEPMDKAGAYGIQGYGSLLVDRIDGDYFNVVGLPVSRLNRELNLI